MTNVLYLGPGLTSGQAITNANKANIGAAVVNLPTGSTAAIDTVARLTVYPLVVTATSLVNGIVRWNFSGGATNDLIAWNYWFYYDRGANTKNEWNYGGIKNTADQQCIRFVIDSADKYRLVDRISAQIDAGNLKIQLTNGNWYQTKGYANRATGQISSVLYDASGTALGTHAKTSGADFGTSAFATAEFGFAASNQLAVLKLSLLDFNDGATAAPADYVPGANAIPTASYASPTTSVATGATVNSTLNGADTDGTITTYEQTVFYSSVTPAPTLTGGAAQNSSFTAPSSAGELIVLRGRVQDNSGAWSDYAFKEVRVPSAAASVGPLPIGQDTYNLYARVGSATTDGAAVGDSDDTTYMESGALTTTAQTFRVRARPMVSKTGTLAYTARLRRNGSGTTLANLRLMEGTTSRGVLTGVSVTDTWTVYELDLTNTQVGNITDPGNLFFEVDGILG